jgi:hypothetical protein
LKLDLSNVSLFPNSVFSASSVYNADHQAHCARVIDPPQSGCSHGIWGVGSDDPPNQWLQIHLPVHKIITEIELISRSDGWTELITKFKIAFANEQQAANGEWETPDTEYIGTTAAGQSVIVAINIATPIKILRIIPTEFQGHISANIELYGIPAATNEVLAPDVTISTTSSSPMLGAVDNIFTFSSSEPRSTFKCSLTGPIEIAPFNCPSPYIIPANTLSSGSYTLTVTVTDASNIEGTSKVLNFEFIGK